MNIYLDIDGVILANDKQPALHADEFIGHLVDNFPVYWLTTHCRFEGDNPVLHLSQFFSNDTVRQLKRVKPAYWDMLKTEGIDFNQPFIWFDDDPLETEKEFLAQRNILSSWVEVDLSKNVHQLRELLKTPALHLSY
ncbi:MAG: hypothetical protein WEC84_01810 [Candidatus Andersenbacteria bacterium]